MHSNRHGQSLVAMAQMAPLAICASMAFAQAATTSDLPAAPIDELKHVYLACDLAASRQLLDAATAAHCSYVSEALLKRAFDGNFELLLAWWRTAKDTAASKHVREQ